MSLIGQPLTRREDPPLLTGRGRYVDDFAPEGTLHAFVVRSPVAHARVTGIDVTVARKTSRSKASARSPARRASRQAR
jgi:carbon-monoxide dehydrogenase large subunit